MEATVTKYGMIDMQVCVPVDWNDQQIINFAELRYPSGTSGWQIRRQGDKALAGDPERQPCADHPNFVYVMLDA